MHEINKNKNVAFPHHPVNHPGYANLIILAIILPKWARVQVGQGPSGWARAQVGQGPSGPGRPRPIILAVRMIV